MGGLLFGFVFVAGGIFVLVQGFKDLRKRSRSQNWPFVKGHVVEAAVGPADGCGKRRVCHPLLPSRCLCLLRRWRELYE